MRVTRSLLLACSVLLAAPASAGNVSAPTGPLEPSQIQSIINQLVQSVNSQVNGLLASFNTQVATGAVTTPVKLYVYTMPASQLSVNGQAIRVSCWGQLASNTNVKTVALSFGNSPVITNYFSSANVTQNPQGRWKMNMIVTKAGAASGWVVGDGVFNANTVSAYALPTTADFSTDTTVTCEGLNGTAAAADIIADGMLVEQIK